MAFALLGALTPFIAEGAVAAGGVVVEATGSELLGGLVSGAILDKAGEVVDSSVGVLSDKIFGAGSFDNFKADAYDNYDTAKKLGLFSSDVNHKSNKEIVEILRKKNMGHEEIVKEVANFGSDLSKEVSEQPSGLPAILTNLSKVNPLYYYLSTKLLNSGADWLIPNNEEYTKISSIYNGKGLYDQMVSVTQLETGVRFSLVDETGTVKYWDYPEYNNYTVVPPLWGVWTGMNSPNDSVPIKGVINDVVVQSFLDKIAFLHDISYKEFGSFTLLGDYALISRANYGKANNLFVLPGELEVANVAIAWFSSLGSVMRKLFGSEGDSTAIKDLYSDVYSVELDDSHLENLKESTRSETSFSRNSKDTELVNFINSMEIEID